MKAGLRLFFIFALGLISSTNIVLAQTDYEGCGMMNWMNGGYGMGFFGWIIWILVVAILVLLIVWLVKQINKKK